MLGRVIDALSGYGNGIMTSRRLDLGLRQVVALAALAHLPLSADLLRSHAPTTLMAL